MMADSKQGANKNIETLGWHWYDFTCPFCYLSKSRNKILQDKGYNLIQLPFQAHPEIPPEGIYIGERGGPMYEILEREAIEAKLPLNWPDRVPNSGYALALAEQVRRHLPGIFAEVKDKLYALHFVLNENLGSKEIVNRSLEALGVGEQEIEKWLEGDQAFEDLRLSQNIARRVGVRGTPAWMLHNEVVLGLQPRSYFEKLGN
jgi:predicted DsbA family dithiol-disulfide isomerase